MEKDQKESQLPAPLAPPVSEGLGTEWGAGSVMGHAVFASIVDDDLTGEEGPVDTWGEGDGTHREAGEGSSYDAHA